MFFPIFRIFFFFSLYRNHAIRIILPSNTWRLLNVIVFGVCKRWYIHRRGVRDKTRYANITHFNYSTQMYYTRYYREFVCPFFLLLFAFMHDAVSCGVVTPEQTPFSSSVFLYFFFLFFVNEEVYKDGTLARGYRDAIQRKTSMHRSVTSAR